MPLMIYTTVPSKRVGRRLAKKLCRKKLAACVQIHKIRSLYVWQDRICNEREVALNIKTKTRFYKKICKFLRHHHPYEVPEIIGLKIYKTEKHYKRWLQDSLKPT